VTIAVYLPLLVCALSGLVARPLAARLPPGAGAWTLAAAAIAGAVSGLWTVGLLAASLIDDVSFLAAGHPALPVHDSVSVAAGAVLAWSGARLGAEVLRQRRLRRELRQVRALPGDDLVVLPDVRALAFALPGRRGRVVATDTMLRALDPLQRRVLIAHERAHLDARHPSMLALVHLAAAANPLLIPVARAADFLCERHADECAAAAVGDRKVAARALATAALAGAGDSRPARRLASPLPAFQQSAVLDRVAALRAPVRRSGRFAIWTAVFAVGLIVFATAHATGEFVQLAATFLAR
jgi:Zn-dependent protease with chaperone function